MAEFDTVIKGGTIVDGTLVPPFKSDLGIKDGRIAKIGYLKDSEARQTLDAAGSIIAPGVIDLHCHYDAPVFWDPACSIGSWHGVTSVTNGNCGFGFAPVHAKDAERAMLSMERNEAIPFAAMKATMPFTWETFPQWMDHIERLPKAVNMMQLVPVTPLGQLCDGRVGSGQEPAAERKRKSARWSRFWIRRWRPALTGWAAQSSERQVLDPARLRWFVDDLGPDVGLGVPISSRRGLRKFDRGSYSVRAESPAARATDKRGRAAILISAANWRRRVIGR